MTLAVAKQLAADLLGYGLTVTVRPRDGGDFQVEVEGAFDALQVAAAVTKFSVTCPMRNATFI